MRRTAFVFVIMAMTLVVGGGAALAATINCDGGVCEGTDLSDNLTSTGIVRDIMYGFGDRDRLNASGGDDVLYGNEGNDILRGGRGDDDMYGGPGNENFYGEAGADYFNGGAGKDRMTGGEGADDLLGGEGDDTIAVQDGVFDKVNCGPGDYDAVVIDRGLDSVRNCENVYWQ